MKSSIRDRVLPPLLFVIAIFVSLETLVYMGLVDGALIPPPSSVLISYSTEFDLYGEAALNTFISALKGFGWAIALGISLASAMSFSRWLRHGILPLAVFFQTVPVIAVAPVIVIYLGFGEPTIVFCSALVAIFPVIANTLVGLSDYSAGFEDVMKVYKVPPWKQFIYFRIPHAVPSTLSGIKISAGLSVIGVVAGEFVAGGGLGALIDVARTQQRLELVYGSLFLLAIIGIILLSGVSLLGYGLKIWRPLSSEFRK